MSKNITNTEARLEELMLEKAYEELNFEEIQFVVEHMDAADYTAHRTLILAAIDHFESERESISPPEAIKTSLVNAMNDKKAKSVWYTKVVQIQVPAYQPAMVAVAAILLAFWMWPGSVEQVVPVKETGYVYHTDTFYRDYKESPAHMAVVKEHASIVQTASRGPVEETRDAMQVKKATYKPTHASLLQPVVAVQREPGEPLALSRKSANPMNSRSAKNKVGRTLNEDTLLTRFMFSLD